MSLPAVILTLLSIIQAIALDMLWSQSLGRFSFEIVTPVIVAGWLQSIATLLVLIMVWMAFVGLIMRFVWTPALLDTALPFLIGILQFAVIEVAVPDLLGIWLIGLGVLMLAITAISQRYYKRARQDPRNAEFFHNIAPATWRDMIPSFGTAAFCFLTGAIVLSHQMSGWFAILIVVVLILGLGYFVFEQNKYWVRSVSTDALPSNSDEPAAG